MVPLSFGTTELLLRSDRAVYWPRERTLFVADLHLEKASFFASHGQPLPPYDSRATLERVARAVEETRAERVVTLGDNFHDSAGSTRLEEHAAGMLHALTRAVDWVWITGNHDIGVAAMPGGRRVAQAQIGGIWLRHEAQAGDPDPEISGHFHPKLRLSLRGRHVSRRCFVGSATKLILPALGALTGGLDAGHGEIRRAVGPGAAALVPVADRLLRFPLS